MILLNLDENKAKYIEKIKTFVLKVNKIACRIEFSAPCEKFVEPIWELANLIDIWNKNYFNEFGFKLEILLMQVALILNFHIKINIF